MRAFGEYVALAIATAGRTLVSCAPTRMPTTTSPGFPGPLIPQRRGEAMRLCIHSGRHRTRNLTSRSCGSARAPLTAPPLDPIRSWLNRRNHPDSPYRRCIDCSILRLSLRFTRRPSAPRGQYPSEKAANGKYWKRNSPHRFSAQPLYRIVFAQAGWLFRPVRKNSAKAEDTLSP
jgi:hypothetical protein